MNRLTLEQIKSFQREGYLLIESAISQVTVKKCREATERIRSKCESGQYPNIRHEILIDDNEFRGVEHIFSKEIFEGELLEALIEAKVLELSQELLDQRNVSLILNRLHCTKYYGLSGFWHRDGACNENWHIQSSLHFYNEAGFFVIPGSHNSSSDDDTLIKNFGGRRGKIEGMKLLPVKAGDLLLFDSAIFHRGQCPGRTKYSRSHVHLRICRDEAVEKVSIFENENWNHDATLSKADDGWKELFTKIRPEPKFYMKSITRSNDHSFKALIRQSKNKFFYNLSRFISQESDLIKKPNRVVPYPYVQIPEGYEKFLLENREN